MGPIRRAQSLGPSRSRRARVTAGRPEADPEPDGGAVEPFTIAVTDEVLDDLRRRVRRTRWTDSVEGSGWDYGADLATVRRLAEYWENGFDWRAQERRLNEVLP